MNLNVSNEFLNYLALFPAEDRMMATYLLQKSNQSTTPIPPTPSTVMMPVSSDNETPVFNRHRHTFAGMSDSGVATSLETGHHHLDKVSGSWQSLIVAQKNIMEYILHQCEVHETNLFDFNEANTRMFKMENVELSEYHF